jgi:hypothetical protein
LPELKTLVDSCAIIVADFNNGQVIQTEDKENFSNTMNQLNVTGTHKTPNPTIPQYTFSTAHRISPEWSNCFVMPKNNFQ